MSTVETMEKMRAELSALTLDLEQAAITIAAKAGAARALRDHALDMMTDLSESPPPAETDFDHTSPAYPFAVSREAPPAVLDVLLWQTTPVLTVAKYAEFEPLPVDTSGHRYLVAADGLWLECRRPWLHLVWPLATIDEPGDCRPAMRSPIGWTVNHTAPFGVLARKVEIAFGKVPHLFIQGIAASGRQCLPNECGGWVTWEHSIEGCTPRLVWDRKGQDVGTPGSLTYPRPEHTATLSPCIDLHTHGTAPAFFSVTDDADDAHDVKIAIVLGNLDQPIPTIAARLCCLGVFIPVNVSAEQVFGGGA